MVMPMVCARFLRQLCLCVVALALSPCSTVAASSIVPSMNGGGQQLWLLVSDVHFNPFDDPSIIKRLIRAPESDWHTIFASRERPPSSYFTDTNFALFESALGAMRRALPNPPVVIIAGDSMGHKFPERFAQYAPNEPQTVYQQFVDKTIAFLASEFNAAYPSAQFLITIGNNDGYCGNYMSTPGSPFLAHMAAAWQPLINRGGAAPNFMRDFSLGGYYTSRLPSQPMMPAIVLNSVFWSAYYKNNCATGPDPGLVELAWLASALRSTAAPPLLMTHIPPGIDEYLSLNNNAVTPLYKEQYTQQLLSLIGADAIAPRAFILGHIHHATFEIANTFGGQLGMLGVPSISPDQGNNPAFVVAAIGGASPTIADTSTFILPLSSSSTWRSLYSFDSAYGLSAFDAPNLFKLQSGIANDTSTRATFFTNYNSASTTATPSPAKWRWYWCGHTNLTPAPYAACVNQSAQKAGAPGP